MIAKTENILSDILRDMCELELELKDNTHRKHALWCWSIKKAAKNLKFS